MPTARDKRIAQRLSVWFGAAARDLPWRITPRDPYRSLVSEAMLQQTQVSRVLEKFEPFIARFPSARALAEAPEQEVLAMWSGLGYYRRARNLHRAAKAIIAEHGGRVPEDYDQLRSLPGVGAYTAGAIASIVFNQPVSAVDANARRVILRIEGLPAATSERALHSRATDLARAAASPAAFNEGLMELGALVCSPATPRCGECPMARLCRSRATDGQEASRPRKAPSMRRAVYHSSVLVTDARGRVRAHARPAQGPGLWSGMFQPPTIERQDRHATEQEIRARFGVRGLRLLTEFEHITTHRRVRFEVWQAAGATRGARLPGRFMDPAEVASAPLASPHRRILLAMGAAQRERPVSARP